ncbi:Cof-type HAD-IIB family hydrolase [Clostridium sp. A1-XYC3]|uniref:Cof-type HAD-IIB family hydrolase n=1 Tax=Clostridium tanneri TaxID=3037988 RepID=A0ABU4JVZ8_9CLOT|nr:Cof-type HAD-IIB family hydrolase [Clostridium sp. A1-XYC3]MDW8802324.1 Cof-type HAD-IIB family hydrolase [Clostridium sp. A1-XYC3]
MIKLIATDMDGTLLNEQDKINEEFFHVLNELREKNILFTAASGRQYYNLLNKFSKAKDDILYVAENGSYVIFRGEELYSSVIDKTVVKSLLDLGRQIEDCELIICGKKSAYVEKNHKKFIEEVERYYLKYEIVDSLDHVDDDILKVTLCDFKGALENSNKIFKASYGDTLQITVSGKIWLDVINKDVNKGTAIKLLQEKFNIKPEETMVFGDYFNDIEMFKSAYYSYAMANAPEEVKKHSRFIAESNRDNGVLKVIKDKIL